MSLLKNWQVILEQVLVFGCSLGIFIFSQHETLSQAFILDDDWPQHLLWLYQYTSSDFLEGDYYMEASQVLQPWGYWLLNRILVVFFHPLTISKVFPFFLLYATSWFTYYLLRPRMGWVLALAGMLLMANIPHERMIGFFARGFGFPLIMGFLYFWVNEQKKGISIFLFLSTLFYPVSFLLAASIQGLGFIKNSIQHSFKSTIKKQKTALLSILVCLVVLLLKSYQIRTHPLTGGFLSKKALLSLPEFGAGGRVDFSSNMDFGMVWDYLRLPYVLLSFAPYEAIISLVLFVLLATFSWKKGFKDRLDLAIIFLGIGSIALFWAAQLLLPSLFLPERYLYYAYLPLVYLLLIRVSAIIASRLKKPILFQFFILIGLSYASLWKVPPKHLGVNNYQDNSSLYEFIQSLPERKLFAGPPNITSQIPSFCQQPVLFSDEAIHAIYFKNYYEYVKPKLADFVAAYSSSNLDSLKSFLVEHQVDYLILDRSFMEKGQIWFHEPYKSQIQESLKNQPIDSLAVNKIPQIYLLDVHWRYKLLDVKPFIQNYANFQ